MTQDKRRAVRTAVHTIGAAVMLAYLGWVISITDKHQTIALGLVAILFIREIFHGAENITARVKFSASATGGVSGEVDPGILREGDEVTLEKNDG